MHGSCQRSFVLPVDSSIPTPPLSCPPPTQIRQDLDNARQQLAAAEASALDLQQRLEAELAVVRAERDELQQQVRQGRAGEALRAGERCG